MNKTQHEWRRNKCTVCGVERDVSFKISEGAFRIIWKYRKPTSKTWKKERPDCTPRSVEDKLGIIPKVNQYFGVDVYRRTKKREVALARQIAVELLWNFGGMSMESIGSLLGIDRTTGIHARRTVWNLCASDPNIRQKVIDLETMIE